jgi:predicted metal-dependent phosphoesterase TrpH
MVKVELHTHTSDDPVDRIPHSTKQLIDRAAALGYHAVAVTLHDRQLDLRPFEEHAAERGIVLIPGIERTILGKHVLLLNFSRAAEQVESFEDLARLKAEERGVVIAPHAFYPTRFCLNELMDRYADLFDAVEYNAMFTRSLNFNRRAERWARAHGKPLVGNGDVHRLAQLGTTYTLVDAPADKDAICEAVRAGRVQVVAKPYSWFTATQVAISLFAPSLTPLIGLPRAADATV